MATNKTSRTKANPLRRFENGGIIDPSIAAACARAGIARPEGLDKWAPQPQAIPVQQPAPQPAPKQETGILSNMKNIFSSRAAKIDKAAGYANGGIVRGIGTPTSDSIDAQVSETGEPIKVSTGERILSKSQDTFLQAVAKDAGFNSLDAMLQAGTGKPVGPTIKAGKRAAVDGLSPDEDPFAYRGGKSFGAAGPVNGPDSTGLNQGIAQQTPSATAPRHGNPLIAGIVAGPLGATQPANGDALANRTPPSPVVGGALSTDAQEAMREKEMNRLLTTDRNSFTAGGKDYTVNPTSQTGISKVTAPGTSPLYTNINPETAVNQLAGMKSGQTRIGDGGFNLAEQNERMAKSLGYAGTDDFNKQWRLRNDPAEQATEVIANPRRDRNPLSDELTRGKIQGTQLRNDRASRLNDLQQQLVKETDPEKQSGIAAQIRALSGKAQPRPADQLSLPQRRSNFEIDAARERIAGLAPDEIKRKTANYTATGRENPDFDPTLAKAVSLAGRRKYGTDDHFDQGQQAQQHAGSDGDVMTRFRADTGMAGHKPGRQTEQGIEVFDSNGRLIGHYR